MGLLCSPCMPRPAYRLCMPFLHLNWYRADNVCDDENRMEEISHLRKTFLGNGYPRGLIERIVNKSPYVPQDPVMSVSSIDTKLKTLCLPYVKNLLEEIQRLCKSLDIRVYNFHIIQYTSTTPYKSEDTDTIEHEERGDLWNFMFGL